MILSNPELYALWNQAKALDAGPAHRLQTLARVPDGLAQAVREIDLGLWQVQKLDWRIDVTNPYWNGVLTHLTSRCLPDLPESSGIAP